MNSQLLEKLPRKWQIDTELLKRGNHIYDFQPKQLDFANVINIFSTDSLKKTYAYGGAMGGGKTYVCVGLFVELALLYPNSRWTILRESRQRCTETVVIDFKEIAKGRYEFFNEQKLIAYFHNGSIVEFKGENKEKDPDLDAFKSYKTNGFFIEQLEEIQKKTYEMCLIRAGRHRISPMPPQIILASINPSINWVKSHFYEPYVNGTLPEDIIYIPAKISDNIHLSGDVNYMSGFKNLDSLTKARYLDGDWSAFAVNNPFAYAFSETKHVGKCEFSPVHEIMLSFDFNVDPITCIAAQHYDNKIKIIKEFRLSNSDIYQLCDHIKAAYPSGLFLVTGDASGHNRSALAKGNINYYTVIQQSLNLMNTQMKQPSVNPAISDTRVLMNSMFQNYNIVFDKDNCAHTIKDLKYTEVDVNGDIKKKENEKMGMGHLLDATRYMMNTFFGWFINLK